MEQEDQCTHDMSFETELDPETNLSKLLLPSSMVLCYFHDVEETYTFLWQRADFFQPADVFRVNPNFVEDEKAYENLKKSILGDELDADEEGSDDASDDEDEEESDDEDDEEQMEIRDKTETNLINLRRTIYLTIMSSVDFEEAGHKLLKIKLEPGQEVSTVLHLILYLMLASVLSGTVTC